MPSVPRVGTVWPSVIAAGICRNNHRDAGAGAGWTPRIGPPVRPSQIDAYLPFIRQTLETFPTLTASRLYGMVREHGYRGSPDHFRHVIAAIGRAHRPRRICGCVACRVNRRRWTGDISAISRSAAHGAR